MKQTKQLMIKTCPEELHTRIKMYAAKHKKSISSIFVPILNDILAELEALDKIDDNPLKNPN